MRLAIAAALGSAGALAIPWAIEGGTGELADLLQFGLMRAHIGDWYFDWSWPLFGIVTLFAWGMLVWAGDG